MLFCIFHCESFSQSLPSPFFPGHRLTWLTSHIHSLFVPLWNRTTELAQLGFRVPCVKLKRIFIFDNDYFHSRVVPCVRHLHPIFYFTIFSWASLGAVFHVFQNSSILSSAGQWPTNSVGIDGCMAFPFSGRWWLGKPHHVPWADLFGLQDRSTGIGSLWFAG